MSNTAEITETGTLTLIRDGARSVTRHDDLDTARRAAIEKLAADAPADGIVVQSIDPEFPSGWIRVFPDKRVEVAEEPELMPRAARRAARAGEPDSESAETVQPIVLPAPSITLPEQAAVLEVEPEQAAAPHPVPVLEAGPEPIAPLEAEPATPENEPLRRPRVRHGETAELFSDTRAPSKPLPAAEGVRGLLNTLSGGLLGLPPSTRESELRASTAAVQRGLSTHKTVSFLNLKGGATKTTACWCIGAVLGRTRGGSVLAWDNNENKGTLAERAGAASHDHTAVDLLRTIDELDESAISTELMSFVRPQGSNHFDVLASQNTGSKAQVIDGDGFARLHRALRRFYRLILVDTGNASNADTWQGAVNTSDVLVLCTLNREDVAKTAFATLDTLHEQGHGEKVANAVAIITETQRPNADRMRRMTELFGELVAEVVQVPFDKHLDDGETIEWGKLAPDTQTAYLHAAATIVRRL